MLTTTVFEDDGSYKPALKPVTITWQPGKEHGSIQRDEPSRQTRYMGKTLGPHSVEAHLHFSTDGRCNFNISHQTSLENRSAISSS